jgi:hypothetical protein
VSIGRADEHVTVAEFLHITKAYTPAAFAWLAARGA